MSNRPTTPAHRPSRVEEAIQVAPYLTHIVRHHGQLTLIPPENEGRIRKVKTRRSAHIGSRSRSYVSLPDAAQSSATRSRALSSRPSSVSLAVERPRLHDAIRSLSKNNVARANTGTSNVRADESSSSAVETIPDLPPPTFEEALANSHSMSTEVDVSTNIEEPSDGMEMESDALVDSASTRHTYLESPSTDDDGTSDSISTSSSRLSLEEARKENVRASLWEEDRLAGTFSLEDRVKRELSRRRRQDSVTSSGGNTSFHPKKEASIISDDEICRSQSSVKEHQKREKLWGESGCPGSSSSSLTAQDWNSLDESSSSQTACTTLSIRTNLDTVIATGGRPFALVNKSDPPPFIRKALPNTPSASPSPVKSESLSFSRCPSTALNPELAALRISPQTRHFTAGDHEFGNCEYRSQTDTQSSSTGNISKDSNLETIDLLQHLKCSETDANAQCRIQHTTLPHDLKPSISSYHTTTLLQSFAEDIHPIFAPSTAKMSSNAQLSSIDGDQSHYSKPPLLTDDSTSPHGLTSTHSNNSSGTKGRSEIVVFDCPSAPNSLALSLTNRPLPSLPPTLSRIMRPPPSLPFKSTDYLGELELHQYPDVDASVGSHFEVKKARRVPPPPPPPRRSSRKSPGAPLPHEIVSGSMNTSYILGEPSTPLSHLESAGSHVLPVQTEHCLDSVDDDRATDACGTGSAPHNSSSIPGVQSSDSVDDNVQRDTPVVAGSASSLRMNGPSTTSSPGFGTGASDNGAIDYAGSSTHHSSSEDLISSASGSGAAALPRVPIPDISLTANQQDRPIDLGLTDLDLLLNTLDDESQTSNGLAYNELLILGDVLGPAQASSTPGRTHLVSSLDELGNVFLGKVAVDRRRVTKDGRTKLKLSLFGVVVDKCSICLTQFKEHSWACLLPCQHVFHEKCCRRWLLRSVSCPLCRSLVT